jgi:hypothetical protein
VSHEPIGTVKSDKVTEPVSGTGFSPDGSTQFGTPGDKTLRNIYLKKAGFQLSRSSGIGLFTLGNRNLAFVANSLCAGERKRTTREPEVPIGNSY